MKVEGKEYISLWFENNSVKFMEQRKLPYKFEIFIAEVIVCMISVSSGLGARL